MAAKAIKDKPISDAREVIHHIRAHPEKDPQEAARDVDLLPKGVTMTMYFEADLVRAIEKAQADLDLGFKDIVKAAVKNFLKERNYYKK